MKCVTVARAATVALVVGLLVAGAVVRAPAAVSSASSSSLQGNCRVRAITALFWPRGHSAIASIGHSASNKPHMEIFAYQGSGTYVAVNVLAYADAKGKVDVAQRCQRVQVGTVSDKGLGSTVRRATAVSCSFRNFAQVMVIGSVGSDRHAEARVLDGPSKSAVRARLVQSGSTLSYNTQQCRIGTAPR